MMMGLFSSFKDNLSSFSGEKFVRKAVERYGDMQDFKINSSAKSIYVKILLKGEKEPVEVKVNRYELIEESDRLFLRLYDVTTSREWFTQLAEDFLTTQRFEIPEKFSSMVKMFI
jgi:hypothetical protein